MSMTAEKEQKATNEIAGLEKRSKGFWQDSFIEEFALMARKLRKGAVDQYTPIIARKLLKIDAAISLLERNPQMAKDYAEKGKDAMDVLELIEAKAADMESEAQLIVAAQVVRKTLPGARLNQIMRQSKVGGFAGKNGYIGIDDTTLWTKQDAAAKVRAAEEA